MTALKVLVLNSGGSSVKCQLFDLPAGTSLAKGVVERVGQPASRLTVSRPGAAGLTAEFACPTHLEAVERIMAAFHDTQGGTLPPLPEVEVVGHRAPRPVTTARTVRAMSTRSRVMDQFST